MISTPTKQREVKLRQSPAKKTLSFEPQSSAICKVEECKSVVFADGFCCVHLPSPTKRCVSPTTLMRKSFGLWDFRVESQGEKGVKVLWKFIFAEKSHTVELFDQTNNKEPKVALYFNKTLVTSQAPNLNAPVWQHTFASGDFSPTPFRCTVVIPLIVEEEYSLNIEGKSFESWKQEFDNQLVKKQAETMSRGLTPVKLVSSDQKDAMDLSGSGRGRRNSSSVLGLASASSSSSSSSDAYDPVLAIRKYLEDNWIQEEDQSKSKLGTTKAVVTWNFTLDGEKHCLILEHSHFNGRRLFKFDGVVIKDVTPTLGLFHKAAGDEHKFTKNGSEFLVQINLDPAGGKKPYIYSLYIDNVPFEVCQVSLIDHVQSGRKLSFSGSPSKFSSSPSKLSGSPSRKVSRVRSSSVSQLLD